jgi:hypothetical protein
MNYLICKKCKVENYFVGIDFRPSFNEHKWFDCCCWFCKLEKTSTPNRELTWHKMENVCPYLLEHILTSQGWKYKFYRVYYCLYYEFKEFISDVKRENFRHVKALFLIILILLGIACII